MSFDGKGLIVHNLPMDAETLGTLANHLRLDWLAFKIHDGGSAWDSSRRVMPEYIARLRAVFYGKVNGWGYVYCDGIDTSRGPFRDDEVDNDGIKLNDRGIGIPELEAAAATTKLAELQLDGYAADLEKQCEGHRDLVSRFFDAFDSGTDTIVGGPQKQPFNGDVGVFTWANVAGHEDYPADVIRNWVRTHDGIALPMVYRPTWCIENGAIPFIGGGFDEIDRVCPVLSIYGTEQALRDDVADWHNPNVAFWSAEPFLEASNLSPLTINRLSEFIRELSPPKDVHVDAFFDVIFSVAGAWYNATEDDLAIFVQQTIRCAKGETSRAQLVQWCNDNLF